MNFVGNHCATTCSSLASMIRIRISAVRCSYEITHFLPTFSADWRRTSSGTNMSCPRCSPNSPRSEEEDAHVRRVRGTSGTLPPPAAPPLLLPTARPVPPLRLRPLPPFFGITARARSGRCPCELSSRPAKCSPDWRRTSGTQAGKQNYPHEVPTRAATAAIASTSKQKKLRNLIRSPRSELLAPRVLLKKIRSPRSELLPVHF